MFCPKCGEILRDGTRKCPVCGARISGRSTVNRRPVQVPSAPDSYDHTHYECEQKDCTQVNFTCEHAKKSGSSMGLLEACRLFFVRYKDFKGRSGRKEFWLAVLMLVVGLIFLSSFGLGGAWVLITLVPAVTLTIRRFHDIGFSGYFALVILLPLVGSILFLVLVSRPSGPANEWGSPAA